MNSWKEERDRLIDETMAFVQGVARKHPAVARRLNGRIAQPAVLTETGSAETDLVEAGLAETGSKVTIAPTDEPQIRGDDPVRELELSQSDVVSSDVVSAGVASSGALSESEVIPKPEAAVDASLQQGDTYLAATSAPDAGRFIMTDLLPEQQNVESLQPGLPPTSERAAIASRVAAFKAQQDRMSAEREAFYEETQKRIKTALRNKINDQRL